MLVCGKRASLAQGVLANMRAACLAQWPCMCMCCCCVDVCVLMCFAYLSYTRAATNALAQALMKDAARCDMHGDLQNSVNQLVSECSHCFQIFWQASRKHCLLMCISRCCEASMLDGTDAMIVRTIMQVLLLVLHCTLGSQMIVLPCFSHT